MKTRPILASQLSGSTLVIAVICCALIGTVLCSFLVLIVHRNTGAFRAAAWNSAIPVLEAGIEEALTHLRVDNHKPNANNWMAGMEDGQSFYWKRRDLPDGSYFSVTNFNPTSRSPIILSAGYVRSPLKKDDYISRLVRVTTTNPPSVYSQAIASDGVIKLSGNTSIDGFNSKGYNSAIEAYNDPTNRNASGGIVTNSRELKAIEVGTGHVYGKAVTGEGGTVSVAGGTVGDLEWSKTHSGIQPGWTGDDNYVDFDEIAPPTPNPTWQSPMYVSSGGSNITILKDGTYSLPSFASFSMTKPMVVIGKAELWVKNTFTIGGQPDTGGYVYIAPGASLKLYVSSTASISGGGVVNATGLPANFEYYGMPSSKTFTYSGAANFIGTINSPQANVALTGGSSIYGAVICQTFTCSGGSSVHYDQGLGGGDEFRIISWREL
jgi:hypothetical protein